MDGGHLCSTVCKRSQFFGRRGNLYRLVLEKQEGCGVVAHERLIEPRTFRGPYGR